MKLKHCRDTYGMIEYLMQLENSIPTAHSVNYKYELNHPETITTIGLIHIL